MKFIKRISIFFIMPIAMFVGGLAVGMGILDYFYPGKTEKTPIPFQEEKAVESIEVAVQAEVTITADTTYVIQEHDDVSGLIEETDSIAPEKYIGMTRELFLKTIEEYNTFPSLKDLEKGFVGCEVVSFSPQKVIVRKNYLLEEMPEGFFLINENNYITVYYGDLEKIYMNTNIKLKDLPEELQQEIIYIKFIEKEEELYDFLESYSS